MLALFPLRYVDGLQGRSAVAYRESAWLRGLPTLKLPNQRCREQRFEIADFLFGRALRPSAAPAAISASSTSELSPIRPRQTARLSASSRPPCANGPTLRPTPPRITAPPRCRSGCTDTTGTGRTAV